MSEEWRALGAEAARFLREERWAEATGVLQSMLAMRPDHADSWFNLGYAERHARRYDAALDAYQKALELGVSGAEEIHLNRAVILSEHLHRVDDAEAELRRAVEINPAFVAAWVNLGNLREDIGDGAGARAAYQRALDAVPGTGRALARIATIMAQEGQPAAAVRFLREKGIAVRPGSENQAEVAFALGNMLDADGDYPAAFAAIRQANALAAGLRPPGRRYDPQAHERLVSAIIAAFPEAAEARDADESPVAFICGMFRSGSTLTEQMIARHSQVSAGGELEFIPAMIAENLQPYPASVASLSPSETNGLRERYRSQVEALFPEARIVTDKRPDNFLHIGLIKTLFPTAKIVHTVRNPLDTIVSAYFLYFGDSITYSDRLTDLTHYYVQYRRLMAHWERLYGDDIFIADYDRLVAEPRSVMQPLTAFLGLEWEESCLDQRDAREPVRTASVWQVRKPLHRRSSGRWRNYESELEGVRAALAAHSLLPRGA